MSKLLPETRMCSIQEEEITHRPNDTAVDGGCVARGVCDACHQYAHTVLANKRAVSLEPFQTMVKMLSEEVKRSQDAQDEGRYDQTAR